MKNTNKIVSLAKDKSEQKQQEVINTINEMIKSEDKITFYSVYQKAGVSKSFVYNNEQIRGLIESHRKTTIKMRQSQDAKDVIIESLKRKIKDLENENNGLKKDESWKDKHDKLSVENKQLKLQLEKAYKY